MHFVNQSLETRFGFRRRLEREQQMIESQAVGDRAAIIACLEHSSGGVSRKSHQPGFVNRFVITGFGPTLTPAVGVSAKVANEHRPNEHRISMEAEKRIVRTSESKRPRTDEGEPRKPATPRW